MGSAIIIRAVCMSAVSITAYMKVKRWFNNNNKKKLLLSQEDGDDLRVKERISMNCIPRELIELILSKVDDIVSLCRCSIVSREMYDIVTSMRVIYFTMPRSLINYPKLSPLSFSVVFFPFPPGLIQHEVDRCILSVNQKKSCDFFTRFSLLESVFVQLPPPPVPFDSWFRWDSQINVTSHISSYYFISVNATLVNNNNNNNNNNQSAPVVSPVTQREATRRAHVTWRHLKLHANTVLTQFPSMKINPTVKAFYHHPRLTTIVSKDDDDTNSNGRLTLYKTDKDEDKDKLYRCKFCYLYNELELKCSGVTIKDAWLWFYYYDKGGSVGDDDGDDFSNKAHEDDLIMSCFDRGDYSREELKEAVTKILGHINTLHYSRLLGIVQSQNIMNKLLKL